MAFILIVSTVISSLVRTKPNNFPVITIRNHFRGLMLCFRSLLETLCREGRGLERESGRSSDSGLQQGNQARRELYSLATKILDLHSAVTRRRIEIGLLQRVKTLSAILEAHIPYLDQWSAFEEEYSTSLSGASSALLNFSLQLPVSGNVRADMEQLGEAMNSATKVLEIIGFLVQSFMPKVEEMDTLISELARVTNGERAFIEECGDLVFGTYTSQVEECSLRGHLIQSRSGNHAKQNQPQEE